MVVILLIIIMVTRLNRVSGEVVEGIYKRQCNREKTQLTSVLCPDSRACRFLHKITKLPGKFSR